MSGAGTWDMSFLVDQDARILEGRGACSEHLGEALQNLIGRSLTGFVAVSERKYLRRFLAQLHRPNAKRAVVITLQSVANGTRTYAMEAQRGRSDSDHWLLFAATEQAGDSFADLSLPPAMVDDGQFLRLVEIAAAQAHQALELTAIEVAGLSQPEGLAGHAPAERESFERDIGETLAGQAYEGILSNPAPGHYNLLHDPAFGGAAIAADLSTVAERHGISTAEAGIAHVSLEVAPHANAETIRQSLAKMQERLPSRSWDSPPPPRRRLGDGHIAAIIGLGAFLVGIVAVAIWMLARA